jgi:hypothetical protein
LWSLELCDKKLYAFKKVFKATIPERWNNITDVISLGILIWNLKVHKKIVNNYLPIPKITDFVLLAIRKCS